MNKDKTIPLKNGQMNNTEITSIERRLFKVVERLMEEEHLYLNPSLSRATLAKKAHSNATYVGNAVRKSTGKQVGQYITEYRLKAALQVIENNPLITPMELIKQCGFKSRSTFYRHFATRYNLTPNKYRALIEKKQNKAAQE